ncbi:MAG: dephospho-CoA kinase [Candidatus Diapherotrites archaeon]|nr:dephospho-CoA kinase [Candidatus Diapherotrites archaeon]
MTIVGLTGGFGTGKTTVARMLGKMGARVIDVDAISHALAKPSKPLWEKYVRVFGHEVLNTDQTINRKKIAAIVFSDKKKLSRLVRFSHPLILSEMRRQITSAQKKNRLVVVDLPLLFEDHLEREFDSVLVVLANRTNVLRRIVQDRSMTPTEIRARIQSQKPLSLKKKRADFVIDNNQTPRRTKKQARAVYALLAPKP